MSIWRIAKEIERAGLAEAEAAGVDRGMIAAHLAAIADRRRVLRIELLRCGRHVGLSVTTSPTNGRSEANEIYHLLDLARHVRDDGDDWAEHGVERAPEA